mmetsp:Transcript_43344/g.102042  ORF Transcript_43344/g.102042 Transcript_43344/m.102042 type:complete len:507 (+) Transcript_43344:63-1583(+)
MSASVRLLWRAVHALSAVGLSAALTVAHNRGYEDQSSVQAARGGNPGDVAVQGVRPDMSVSHNPDTTAPLPGPMLTSAAPQILGAEKPMLFFLFLVYDHINHEDTWARFFAPAIQGTDYRALVHCKSEESCRKNIRSLHRFEIIPSVPTTYCTDLVAGMNALLKAGLTLRPSGGSASDKFIFVSDSTVPVKPFATVQRRLTMAEAHSSDFCIFPRNEWAEVTGLAAGSGQSMTQVAVKHHQWIILNRKHAQQAVAHASEHMDLMQRFQLNTMSSPNTWRNTGCLDEFWHFAALFGSLSFQEEPTSIFLQDFTGEPLATNNFEIQGECSTFVHWPPRATGLFNNMTVLAQALSADAGTLVAPPSDLHPAVIHRLSKSSLLAMRSSWFLFARKVDSNAEFAGCGSLAEAFDNLVFSEEPRLPAGHTATWAGQGSWLDNRRAVVQIRTSEGALELSGAAPDMDAKGSYCGNNMKVVFSSGYSASATLSPDRGSLTWSNGVKWIRAGGAR